MKWFWWIGGAILYLALKSPTGNDSSGMLVVLFVVLMGAMLLGQKAAASAKRKEQEERDRQANELAQSLAEEAKQAQGSKANDSAGT